MSKGSKSELLLANAKRAIDAIVSDSELDDDAKEEILEELQEHAEDAMRILSDEDEEDEEDEEEDDEEEEDEVE